MTKDVSLKVFSKKININKGLYIIATPIGNISDITIRALKIFEKSDTIVCEDTRVSKRLFNLLGIEIRTKNWLIYNDHSQEKDIVVVMNELKKGKIVSLISDAGTPLISDPGYKLVNHIIKKNYNVYSIPGPCSAIASLALSGLRTDKFFFIGFLPKNKNDYVSILRNYSNLKCSLIIYEKPKRLNFLFEKIKENCKNFKIVVIKELTKVYEETIAVSSKNIEDYIKKKKILKGELTVIVEIIDNVNKIYTDKEILFELKKLKPSQVSAMLSKSSSESREILYKRCMRILYEKNNKK